MSEFGPQYPKIHTLWKRNPKGNRVIVGNYARDEFADLANVMFNWSEKLDGTNTRFYWNGESVVIGGRTDNAVWNPRVLESLRGLLIPEAFEYLYGKKHVVLYGETFGAGIQKGGGYGQNVMFRPFDLRMGTEDGITANSPFTGRHKVTEISHALGVEPVEILSRMTIDQMWSAMVLGKIEGTYPGVELEGVVGRPETPFYVANGESLSPVLVKLKYRDIADLKK
jgi:hypothetical protein